MTTLDSLLAHVPADLAEKIKAAANNEVRMQCAEACLKIELPGPPHLDEFTAKCFKGGIVLAVNEILAGVTK